MTSGECEIDPVTFGLTGGPAMTLTDREFDLQQWPPCPVCGAQIHVDRINVQGPSDRFPAYMIGEWRCDLGCDPRKDPPPRYHATGRVIFAQRGPEPGPDDLLVGMMDTPALAARMVEAINARPAQHRVQGGLPDFDG